MASNNEIVISLKGRLFRDTQCSSRLPVSRLSPAPRAGSPPEKSYQAGGKSYVISLDRSFIMICGLLHCHQWTSHSCLWFSNLYPMALKNQKYVFRISQMHQRLDLGKPKCCWLAISRSHKYTPYC